MSLKNILGFDLSTSDACIKAIRNGGVAAMISAGLTAIFATIGLFIGASVEDDPLGYILNPFLYIDVVVAVILGIFIFRRSRIAATIMFLYFIVSQVSAVVAIQRPPGFLAIIFFILYLQAMRATYKWHKDFR
ncbi:MAG: hypothetical protein AAFN08_02980 [Cyanobacteria bacterium J06559_3]